MNDSRGAGAVTPRTDEPGDSRRTLLVQIDVRRATLVLLWACVGIEIALMTADYWINYRELTDIGAIRRLFNNTREDSLASLFAVTQAVFVALTLWVLWFVCRRRGSSARLAAGWLVLALFFSWMAIDDGARLHERLGTAAEELIEQGGVIEAFPSYEWQVILVPVFGALGLFSLLFLWTQIQGGGRWLVVAAFVCLPIAVGLDFLEGLEDDHAWNLYAWTVAHYEWMPTVLKCSTSMAYRPCSTSHARWRRRWRCSRQLSCGSCFSATSARSSTSFASAGPDPPRSAPALSPGATRLRVPPQMGGSPVI